MPPISLTHGIPPAGHVELSVVIPVYGCAETLQPLHSRLSRVLPTLVGSYEIVFVDDRCNDGSWDILQSIAQNDPRVVACRMSKNVGQHLAITAGLEHCCGAYAVVMDCDLQDPPETIPDLLAAARRGADIVLARRKSEYQSAKRLFANRLYFRVLALVSGSYFDGDYAAFSIISRRVIDAFLQFREHDRHYLMVLHQIGFETDTIEYTRATRAIGKTSYSWRKLIGHALSGMFFTTTRLLHWVIYAGLSLAALGLVSTVVIALLWLIHGAAPGWTSLIVVQLLLGGLITLCIGVTGLYVGKTFEATQQRPLYFVQDRLDGSRSVEQRRADIRAAGS